MKLRCQHKSGQSMIEVPDDATLDQLREALHGASGIAPDRQKIKLGFPPKEVPAGQAGDTSIKALGAQNNDTLRLEENDGPQTAAPQASKPTQQTPQPPTAQTSSAQQGASSGTQAGATPAAAPAVERREVRPLVTRPDALDQDIPGKVVRRIIPADNSCLFSALSYVIEGNHSRDGAYHMRESVARHIAAHQEDFNATLLEKENDEYQKWILDKQHWGGAIELTILCQLYQCEIACLDVKSMRMDCFGEGQGFPRRVYLVYDGIHYDALAFELIPDDESADISMFSPTDQRVQNLASSVVSELNKQRQFTDTAGFTLRCIICKAGVKGEKGATEHARATGHTSFGEY